MTDHVFPVGQALGAFGGDADTDTVRLGDDYVDLGADEYGLWLLAFGVAGMDELRAAASEYSQYADLDGLTARLVERGVLVRCSDAELPEVFSRHRLVAQGYGFGITEDDRDTFTIADLDGTPRIRVGRVAYRVWSTSWLGSLWMLCEDFAEEAGVPADEVAPAVAGELVQLLGCRAALLDRWP